MGKKKILMLGCLTVLAGITLVALILIAFLKYQIRNQDPENEEFYVTVLGSDIQPVKTLAACTTAPWYGALDSAEFYAVALPDVAFASPPPGYPKKMDYQEEHKLVEWGNGPPSKTDRQVLSEGIRFATSWLEQENSCSSKDRPLLLSITAVLDQAGVRFAYVYRNDIGHVDRLALYILDPKNKVFYLLRFGI